jgi:hypothetical protein
MYRAIVRRQPQFHDRSGLPTCQIRNNKTHITASTPPGVGLDIKQVTDEAKDGSALAWAPEMLSPFDLRPAKRNARTHSKKQIKEVADSIFHFGFMNPVTVDDQGWIVADMQGRPLASYLA